MITVELYVVVGPNSVFFGGRLVPGGFEYLKRNLFILAQLNPDIMFHARIAHSSYHGQLGDFIKLDNMEIILKVFDRNDIEDLDLMDSVLQHGTLLNMLFKVIPPETRFLIIIDPDCYCVKSNLISNLIDELERSEIAVAGLPYPAWYPKEYSWETPQLYFSIFDRSKLDPSKIDLRSGGNSVVDLSGYPGTKNYVWRICSKLREIILHFKNFPPHHLIQSILESKMSRLSGRFLIDPLDTAWRISDEIDRVGLRYRIFPYVIKTDIRILGLNLEEYSAQNLDLLRIEGHLGWHFFHHGLLEGRHLGSQGIIPKILQMFLGKISISRSKWPIESLTSRGLIENQSLLEYIINRIPAADCYAVDANLSFFHIGSAGKGQISGEIRVLDEVVSRILEKRQF